MSNQKETFSKGRALKPIFSSYCSTAQDRTLSLAARGLLFYYLSFPEGWKFHPKKIQDDTGIKEDKFLRINKELIDAGYLLRWQEKGASGKWGEIHYEAFYDKDSAKARAAEVEKLNNRIVHNHAKPRKNLEQETESNLPEEKQEKASTDGFEPHREKPEPGKTRYIEESNKLDSKQDKYTLSKERACETDQEKDQEPSNPPPKERLEKDGLFKFGDISNPELSKEDGLPILNLSQVEKDCLVKIGLGLSISVEEARDIAEHVIIEYRAKCGENNTIHKKPYSILAKWMSHSVAKLKEKKAKQNQEKANEPSKEKRESAAKQPEKPRELKDESKKLLDELFELEKRSSRRKTLNEPTNE